MHLWHLPQGSPSGYYSQEIKEESKREEATSPNNWEQNSGLLVSNITL